MQGAPQDMTVGDGLVRDPGRPRVRRPPQARVPAQLAFPAWVVANATRTGHLHLANPLAAFEADSAGWEHLVPGRAYWLCADALLECLTDGSGSPWFRRGELRPGWQMAWDGGFCGYHPAGLESLVPVRHRWDLHAYEGGSAVRRAIPAADECVRSFAAAAASASVRLWDRDTGRVVRSAPWGCLSVVVAGRRAW